MAAKSSHSSNEENVLGRIYKKKLHVEMLVSQQINQGGFQ